MNIMRNERINVAVFKSGKYYKGELIRDRLYVNPTIPSFMYYEKRYCNLTAEKLEEIKNLIPNLGYIEEEDKFIVFDTTKEEYDEITLPLYVDTGVPKYTQKDYTFKFPTEAAREASKIIGKKVFDELYRINHKAEYDKLTTLLKKGNGIAYIDTDEFPNFLILKDHIEDCKVLHDFTAKKKIIGTKAKEEVITLRVPEEYIPFAIGRGGSNVKYMANEIGAKYIKVESL
ncbi:MAG: hypothetical protein E7311_03705 [Clostridiales bacterium]|nr:hypothetical protein [Clostridiales bacterium]